MVKLVRTVEHLHQILNLNNVSANALRHLQGKIVKFLLVSRHVPVVRMDCHVRIKVFQRKMVPHVSVVVLVDFPEQTVKFRIASEVPMVQLVRMVENLLETLKTTLVSAVVLVDIQELIVKQRQLHAQWV